MLKRAGIDTNSRQYQAVMQSMSEHGGVGYTNVQAIKNRMSRYDKDGDYISPFSGLAGLVVTNKNRVVGESMGRVILKKLCAAVAPSKDAAS